MSEAPPYGELPICCVCGEEITSKPKRTEDGRLHHKGCRPAPPRPERPSNVQSLGSFAERKARNVLRGRGQRTLEEDDA